jgi:hypothetical protein
VELGRQVVEEAGSRGETYFNDFWTFDGSWTRIPQTP